MNPYIILGLIFVWGASLLGVGKWQRIEGARSEKVEWQARENAELNAANIEIRRLSDEARAKEKQFATQIAAIGEAHAKESARIRAQRDRDVADAHSGALRLRIPAAPCEARGGGVPDAAPGAAASDVASATQELPRALTASLLGLVNDADELADEVNACWAVVRADRGINLKGP